MVTRTLETAGSIGRASRAVLGTLFVAVPIASSGIDGWDVISALVILPAIACAATLLAGRIHASSVMGRLTVWVAVMGVVIGAWTLLTFVSPFDGAGAALIFFGLSMLLAAAQGLTGCEIAAVPNLVLRRHGQVWCPAFSPIDAAENSDPCRNYFASEKSLCAVQSRAMVRCREARTSRDISIRSADTRVS